MNTRKAQQLEHERPGEEEEHVEHGKAHVAIYDLVALHTINSTSTNTQQEEQQQQCRAHLSSELGSSSGGLPGVVLLVVIGPQLACRTAHTDQDPQDWHCRTASSRTTSDPATAGSVISCSPPT